MHCLAFVFEQMVLPHLKLLEIVDSTGIQKASLEVNSTAFCMVSSKRLAAQHEFRWSSSLLGMESLLLGANLSGVRWL